MNADNPSRDPNEPVFAPNTSRSARRVDEDPTVPQDLDGDGYADTRPTGRDLNGDGYADGARPVPADDRTVRSDAAYSDENGRAVHVDEVRQPVAAEDVRAVRDPNGPTLRQEVIAREQERFGGMKFGSAFFGWLTAMGLAVLLTALFAAIGGAIGLTSPETAEDAANAAEQNIGVATIVGAAVVELVLFISYFAGGYVAGRMARFNGMRQGLAVWLWAIAVAIVVAILSAVAGAQWDLLANLDAFPRVPMSADAMTLTGIVTAVVAAIVTLAGAVLGGAVGMRYHRRVDRVGLGGY